MQDIGLLSHYINEYGPLIVILAVFLVVFLAIIGYILRTNQKSIENSSELNEQLVTTILNNYFEKNSHVLESHKQHEERNIVNIFMELNKTLKSACDRIMRKTNSDRTAIYVFHNGTHASHGLPFFKITCICETISKNSNVNVKISEHSSVPISMFDSIVMNLFYNSEHYININETSDPAEIVFLHDTKIKECFFVPIYDDDNNMMGFVFNGYNTIDENRNVEEEKEYLVDLARMAQPVIEYSKFQQYQNKED